MVEINRGEVERYINAGFSSNKIADIMGVPLRTMSTRIQKLGLRTNQAITLQDTKIIYERNPKKCKNCGNIISYKKRENKFCGHMCSVLARRKRAYYCLSCNRIIEGKGKKYCSNKCQFEFQWNEKVKAANEEIDMSKIFPVFNSKSVKKYLAEVRGHRCEICKRKTWRGKPISLILDHIDGNAENDLKSNLRLVCGNCDAQLPTYKGKNAGRGRYSRRERYRRGKSY